MIQTVLGSIHADEMGFCHSHEHLFLAGGWPERISPALRIDDYQKTLEELCDFRKVGGSCIVDAQPLGCGRMESSLVKASLESGIHIVASTGFHKLAFYPPGHWIYLYSESDLTKVFTNEITHGMYVNTDSSEPTSRIPAKAGVIKCAVDEGRLNDSDKKWFHAAAKASLETGVPILCHTESAQQAVFLLNLLTSQGVSPEKIIMCHLDRSLENIELHREVAGRGAFLEYDTIGRYKYHSDEAEADLICEMVATGCEDSILLGLDTTRERLKSYGGVIGLDHLSLTFIPLLRQKGLDQSVIEKFMIHNPKRAFQLNK